MYKKLFSMVVLSLMTVGLAAAPASAASSHTGSKNATHMELKDNRGKIVCSAYNTSRWSKPVAKGCPNGTFTEQLFNSSWRQIGQKRVTIGGPSGDGTVDLYVGGPAAHVELKNSDGGIVCRAYNTNPNTAPLVRDCPVGYYTAFLFDSHWNQTDRFGVVVRGPRP